MEEKKSFEEESVVLTFTYQTNKQMETMPQIHQQSATLFQCGTGKSTFDFTEICKQLQVEVRNSMSNCEIYFLIFSENMHKILKIFSQYGLRKCR